MLTRRSTLAIGAALLVREAAAAEAGESWTIATEYPATAIAGEGIAAFAGASSGPGLAVTPRYDAPDGLRSAAMPQAVADGRIAAGDAFAPALAKLDPLFQLSALPFLTASADDAARLLALARSGYESALAGRGLFLLYATPWPPAGLWSRAQVTDQAGLQGLRVRTYDAASTTVLARAGAEPEQISFADALPRLRAGALDAVLSSGDGGAGARLWETLPCFTPLDYAFPLSLAFCAAPALDALPAEAADRVRAAARRTEARQFAAMTGRVVANEARMRENGVKFVDGSDVRRSLQVAAAPVIVDWLDRAGEPGRRLVDDFRAGKG